MGEADDESPSELAPISTRIAIIGSGFGGLGAAIRLKEADEHDFVILERAQDVGGTWRDNTYPGCRCDVQSNLYSFSFELNPSWSDTYPSQAEIWDYLKDVAAQHRLSTHLRFGCEVTAVAFDESRGRWRLSTAAGPAVDADIVILATGALAEARLPAIEGIDSFAGPTIHSAAWDDEVELGSKRVGVIGTGASSIQIVPAIVDVAGPMTVFQRTAPWILPHPGHPVSSRAKALYRRLPLAQRLARWSDYWLREWLVIPFVKRPAMMAKAEAQATEHLEAQIVDPALRAKLRPSFRLGCKRVLLSDDYYPAIARDSTRLETRPISRVVPEGVVLDDGQLVELDVLIAATGFQVTDNPTASLVVGRDGLRLDEAYAGTLPSYKGTSFPGFPNLFMITGPNTALGHSSMVFMIESQLNYISAAIAALSASGASLVEPRHEVAAREAAAIQAKLPATVWGTGCSSWYNNAAGKNVTIWPDFTFRYRAATRHFRRDDHVISLRPGSGGINPG